MEESRSVKQKTDLSGLLTLEPSTLENLDIFLSVNVFEADSRTLSPR